MPETNLDTLLAQRAEVERQINLKQVAPLEEALAILDRVAVKTAVADIEKLLPQLDGYQRDILLNFAQTPANLRAQLSQRLEMVKAASAN